MPGIENIKYCNYSVDHHYTIGKEKDYKPPPQNDVNELIDQILGQNAKNTLRIGRSINNTWYFNETVNHCWKHTTHGIQYFIECFV